MHGADEFLCRNCVILKCEAVALVGHRTLTYVSRGQPLDPVSNASLTFRCLEHSLKIIIHNLQNISSFGEAFDHFFGLIKLKI